MMKKEEVSDARERKSQAKELAFVRQRGSPPKEKPPRTPDAGLPGGFGRKAREETRSLEGERKNKKECIMHRPATATMKKEEKGGREGERDGVTLSAALAGVAW